MGPARHRAPAWDRARELLDPLSAEPLPWYAGYASALAGVALVTAAIGAILAAAEIANVSMLYLLVVLGVAVRHGAAPSVAAAVLSFLAFNWFHTQPLHTLTIAKLEELVALLLFLFVAFATSQLAASQRRQAEEARRREREARAYYEVRDHLQEERLQGEVLRRTDRLRAALLSAVSHDFRTPLAAIKATAGTLASSGLGVELGSDALRASASQIEREADRLNRLVENLLDLSRIESGALKLDRQWYPLRELVEDTAARLAARLARHTVRVEVPDDLPPVPLDYVLVGQVLANLLDNAAKYAPPGTSIRVAASRAPGGSPDGADEVRVRVEDEGPGLPPGEASRVFAPFYRVARSGAGDGAAGPAGPAGSAAETPGGAGYGLAVCAGFVAAHGGRIWAERSAGDGAAGERGAGAAFVFALPLSPPGAPSPGQSPHH